MYTRKEASRIRQEFWTTFGKYMSPVPSAEGMPINWINYKTGVKHVFFYMDAGSKKASVGIKLNHPDLEKQQLFFEEFEKLKGVLTEQLQEEWDWNFGFQDENYKTVSTISKQLTPVNIFNQDQWPDLISFFKPRIVALDEFWSNWKYGFEELDGGGW